MKKAYGVVIILIGLVSGALFFSAAYHIEKSGKSLTYLRSQGGGSVAEAYYQEIGQYGIAYSKMYYALGSGIIAITLGIGGGFFIKKD